MAKSEHARPGHGFGTAPVFLAAISTILGAILFLRFGYAVGHAGMLGAVLIVFIGHLITVPTALAVAEIATNLKVEGGGEYFMISRSFGPTIGGTIGISLYLSQAISVAFYMIAFAEAGSATIPWFENTFGLTLQKWMFSVPATVVLLIVIVKRGADVGVMALYAVIAILAASLILFFMGSSQSEGMPLNPSRTVDQPHEFFKVFAIIFPAFTGMTAGVGLSGDLKNPRKSIPLGTLAATFAGMLIYLAVVVKLAYSLSPEELAADQFAMSKIALWGPIIPIGLAAATLSSAIGSILVAPRTLQALALDRMFPLHAINGLFAMGRGDRNEPFNATMLTSVIVLAFVAMGNVDFVAEIISMFFMITYGAICLVSFLEHFAGNPSYRPTFRSKWYFSLIGAIACFVMMFQMHATYASLAVVAMIGLYLSLRRGRDGERDFTAMIRGALFQLTRRLQVMIQKKQSSGQLATWRPSFVAISSSSQTRLAPFDLLRWISHHYGFGTYIHFIKGELTDETNAEARKNLEQLVRRGTASRAGIYVDTIISPSFKTAIAQIVQIPGISGMDNNSVLFEFHEDDVSDIADIITGCSFATIAGFNSCVLRTSEKHFGYKRSLHIWLTPWDYRNANLMILLAYIIIGHAEWRSCDIELFAAFDAGEMSAQVNKLNALIDEGRIPISSKNVNKVPLDDTGTTFESLMESRSEEADLVITGFSVRKLEDDEGAFFKKFKNIKDILFVHAGQRIMISE